MVRDLVVEFVMGRVCYGPRCPGTSETMEMLDQTDD